MARSTNIDVIESIYADLGAVSHDPWLLRVARAITSCLGANLGAVAHSYDANGHPSQWKISCPIVHDGPAELANVVLESFARSTPEFLERCYRDIGPAGSFSEVTGIDLSQLPSGEGGVALRLGILDQVFVNATNADGRGLLIAVNMPVRRALVPAERERLAMIAAHIAAASRLERSLDRVPPAAIFEPDGKAVHVELAHEPLLGPLRQRVVAIERARTKTARGDEDRALAAWKALLAGTYTLLDRFESDGRRYVVALPNAPTVKDPRSLTQREAVTAGLAVRGHSDKLIAYELGVATGTVTALISRALRKVGARSRTEMAKYLSPPSHVDELPLPGGPSLVVMSASTRDDADDGALARLSPRERAVARAVARGLRNDEIAAEQGVSVRTIAKQLTSIYRKLLVTARVDLVRLCQSAGPPAT